MPARLLTVLGLTGLLALAAPATAAAKEGPLERTAEELKEAGKGAGRILSDSWITGKIRTQFAADDLVSNLTLGVDTKGGVVSLEGSVPSEAARARAVTIVRTTDGVRDVIDRLRIEPAR